MKRLIMSAAIASAFAVAAAGVAQDKPQDPNQNPNSPSTRQGSQSQAATSIHGSVVSVDQSGKSFVIKDDSTGKETTVYWDSSTKMNGDLKAGSMVSIQTTDSSGKTMATSIDAKGAKKPY
jgi:hypothetical protein